MAKLVVIESPFKGEMGRNITYVRACMKHSLLNGEAPFASHALYTLPGVLDDTIPEQRQMGMWAGFDWGACADITAVYVDFGISDGMETGIANARAAGRRVSYRCLPPAMMAAAGLGEAHQKYIRKEIAKLVGDGDSPDADTLQAIVELQKLLPDGGFQAYIDEPLTPLPRDEDDAVAAKALGMED